MRLRDLAHHVRCNANRAVIASGGSEVERTTDLIPTSITNCDAAITALKEGPGWNAVARCRCCDRNGAMARSDDARSSVGNCVVAVGRSAATAAAAAVAAAA